MSNGPEITPLASPPTSEPWVPLWPLTPNQQSSKAARVYRATDQSITGAVPTAVSFSNARFDTDGMWSAGAPTRLTCKTASYYVITGSIIWALSSAGIQRRLWLEVNGTRLRIRSFR